MEDTMDAKTSRGQDESDEAYATLEAAIAGLRREDLREWSARFAAARALEAAIAGEVYCETCRDGRGEVYCETCRDTLTS